MTFSNVPRAGRAAATFAVGLAAGAAAGYALNGRRRTLEPASDEEFSRTQVGAWHKVFEALRTGVCVVDADNQVTYANTGARALGVDAETELEPASLRSLAEHVRATGAPRQVELELNQGGDPTAVRVDVAPLPDGHVAVELTDISELHRVERVRRDFVANVGHELKTPVGALQLLAEALADAVDDPAAAARFTTRIQHESARMSRLVSELLELSRLQGAEPMPAPVTVWIDRVVNEAVDRGRTAASAKDITINRTGRRRLAVSGSENQLATALGNLVGNAIAYSPEGTSVTVDTTVKDDSVLIAVTDEGIGIDPSEQHRIFERFYRSDPARSRATGGTGLGLAIVKHIAGNHGGRVDVSSMPGNGATFTLTLPSVTADADEAELSPGEIDTLTTHIEEGRQ
ncbi:sensor histidine kinase [Stackebrandtia nassauensis]|uniref:Sensor-like histidine kinase SenX3 n=1 Tax=Stackebrandtia nassauensis (strain DSM 44728 / CIP 108903 / NRRL B-16338 / NBRC 102104 / LLR-40K-21) TaxID=446470 RepID=D3Q5Z4_STANL|nr:ATP-binding protein [Stackebrandtia nassauensis]ADD40293.1 PAS/PAC sensor signal transduction histidine kinase [Stackebrandtia nassauensis DSM 44728]